MVIIYKVVEQVVGAVATSLEDHVALIGLVVIVVKLIIQTACEWFMIGLIGIRLICGRVDLCCGNLMAHLWAQLRAL